MGKLPKRVITGCRPATRCRCNRCSEAMCRLCGLLRRLCRRTFGILSPVV